jgi:predicted nucleic acid-binding protein
MTFAQIPSGLSIFLDANTLVYHFSAHPTFGPAASQLLLRITQGDVVGLTSTHVVSEVAHRLMTIEASTRFSWPFVGIANRLKRHPAEVQKLATFRQAIQEIPKLGIRILEIQANLIDVAAGVSQQMGLLSNDALIVAAMQANGVRDIASHDADFDRVTGLTRYAPA